MNHEQQLSLISKAWGRKADGWVFFPWIDRAEQVRTGMRRAGYNEGPAFKWPEDRGKILTHMGEHEDHDLYWCPMVFEGEMRQLDYAADEHALWADLDAADPTEIHDYPPTIAWETSPGRYQALWLIAQGDIQGASWPGNENQKLTYHIGADPSGWDTTQLLRIPGWTNHKPEYGDGVSGRVLWTSGRTYLPDEFSDLPPIAGALPQSALESAVVDEVEGVDRHDVIARVRLKLNHKARDILSAKEASGDRSDSLWYLMRCLADAGCSVPEIVAVVRDTPWNKFADRADELKRLILEASKAIAKRDPDALAAMDEEQRRPDPVRLFDAIRDVKPPVWLVEGMLTEGAVGFIAGEPKSFKSWCALDLALSVASGAPFLNFFRVVKPGPVLLIQEEDSAAMMKGRVTKIWSGKSVDKVTVDGDGSVVWEPADEQLGDYDPDVMAYIQNGFVVSDPGWQEWLDDVLSRGMNGEPYRLLIIDTLMMVAGDIDTDRAQEVTTKIFRPMKLLMRKHGCALMIVHHMRKSNDPKAQMRGGQRMLGSVANHAWAEDSIYMMRGSEMTGFVSLRFESKSGPEGLYRMTNIRNKAWEPTIENRSEQDDPDQAPADTASTPKRGKPKPMGRPKAYTNERVLGAIQAIERERDRGATPKEIAERLGMQHVSQVYRTLARSGEELGDDKVWQDDKTKLWHAAG